MSLLMFQTNSVQAEANLPDCGGNGSTQTTFVRAHSVLETHVHAWTSSKIWANRGFFLELLFFNRSPKQKGPIKKTKVVYKKPKQSKASRFKGL